MKFLIHILLLSFLGLSIQAGESEERSFEQDLTSSKNIFLDYQDLGVLLEEAEEGYSESQFDLAYLYYEGETVTKDYKKAFYWMKKAANSGYHQAIDILALMYEEGIGVPQDKVQSLKWSLLHNLYFYDRYYSVGGVYSDMTQAQILKAKNLASKFREKHHSIRKISTDKVSCYNQYDSAHGFCKRAQEKYGAYSLVEPIKVIWKNSENGSEEYLPGGKAYNCQINKVNKGFIETVSLFKEECSFRLKKSKISCQDYPYVEELYFLSPKDVLKNMQNIIDQINSRKDKYKHLVAFCKD